MRMLLLAAGLLFALSALAHADDATKVDLTLKDHKYDPATLHVPAGKPVIITLTNQDKTAEEFDSDDLKTEKVVAAGRKVIIRLPAQKPGTYRFEGEYHDKTAQGTLVAE